MRQNLTADAVERHIEASPEALYDIVSDVTRTPELSPDIVRCEWLDGASGPAVGARFKGVNKQGRGPKWSNKPVVIAANRGREFAFARTEPLGGTVEWRYRFSTEGTGTRVVESYAVTRPIRTAGWFVITTLYGLKDRRGELRASMVATLQRLAEMAEADTAAGSQASARDEP